ncbi:MAG: sugar ABC transporter permease [Thermomicrobiales bacterium]|nr:sugar ABC transporter permease [Thermomicrobiales bacterium]
MAELSPASQDQSSRPRRFGLGMTDARFGLLLSLPVAAILILLNLYPFLYSFWLALRDIDLRFGIDEFTGLDNFRKTLESQDVRDAMWRTVKYSVQVTVYSTLLGLGMAILLNEKFHGRTLLTALILLPWAVSTYAAGIVWRFLLSTETGLFPAVLFRLGITDRPPNLMNIDTALTWIAIAHTWHIAPLGVFFMLATLQVIPQDLYRVGRIDKLNAIGRFRHVTLPYLKAPLLIVLILNTISAVNVFDLIYFTTAGGPGAATRVMTYEVYTTAFLNLRLGLGAAEAWLLLILVILVTLAYVRVLYRKEKKISTGEAAA